VVVRAHDEHAQAERVLREKESFSNPRRISRSARTENGMTFAQELSSLDQRIKQYQLTAFSRCEIVRRAFRDVADRSWFE
jgi:hypothetical protein